MIKKILRKAHIEFRKIFMRRFSQFPRLVKYVFAITSRQFWHSNLVVMEGISQHLKNDRKLTGNRYRLRRYTHMLEKGLTHKQLKKEFGIDYIERAVEQYSKICLNISVDSKEINDEVQWAHDVLSQYFRALGDIKNEKYQKAKKEFHALEIIVETKGYSPFIRIDQPDISIEDLLTLGKRRRSVRFYLGKRVEKYKINNALNFASLAPSACNRQPYKIFIFDEPKKGARN